MKVVCTKCKVAKDSSDFYRERMKRNGLKSRCKSCHNKASLPHQRAYYRRKLKKDPDYFRARRKNRYWENSDFRKKIVEANVKYFKNRYASDPEFRQRIIDTASARYYRLRNSKSWAGVESR